MELRKNMNLSPEEVVAPDSEDWTEMKFTINGNAYSTKDSLRSFVSNGFELDTDYPADRHACSLTASRCIVRYNNVFEILEKWEGSPDIVLAKGITWGSSVEEVKAAYGEPTKETEDESSIKGNGEIEYEPIHKLTYTSDDNKQEMTLHISEWSGLRYMELNDYFDYESEQ